MQLQDEIKNIELMYDKCMLEGSKETRGFSFICYSFFEINQTYFFSSTSPEYYFVIILICISGRDFCDMSKPYDTPRENYSVINAMLPRRYCEVSSLLVITRLYTTT